MAAAVRGGDLLGGDAKGPATARTVVEDDLTLQLLGERVGDREEAQSLWPWKPTARRGSLK
jgi:hypothetical protein